MTLTIEGKTYIKRYLAGWVPSIAASLAFGIGNASESVSDTKLQFETDRANINLTSFDFVTNKLTFKATVPETYAGLIYEVGLYSASTDTMAGQYGAKLLTTFNQATEGWIDPATSTPPTWATGNSRLGDTSMRHAPTASATETDTLPELFLDLSGYSGADRFVFAYSVGNANTASIKYRFMTDSSNYYEITLGTQTAGYRVTEVAKASAVATGVPNWGNITEIRVLTTAGAGGAAQVDFDGIRIDDLDTINPDYVLVSREVLTTPFTKVAGATQEIEFSLDINL